MKRKFQKTFYMISCLFLLSFGLFPHSLLAGAFYFPQIGARAASMGNAFTSIADDASNVFYNPAGMTQIQEPEGNYSLGLMFPDFTYQREANGQVYDTEYQQLRVMTPFYLGYVSPLKKSDATSGFAFYNAWGGLPMWREDAPTRYVLKHNFLAIFNATYALAYPVTDYFSVGAGLSLGYCYNQQRKSIDFQDLAGKEAQEDYYNEMDILVTGDAFAFGANFGLLYKPTDDFSVGFTYTSEEKFNLSPTMKSTTPFIMSALTPMMTLKAKVTIHAPQNAKLGFSYKITDNLTTSFDFTWVNWNVVKNTDMRFKKGDFFIEERDSISIPRNWRDSYTYNFGFEYITDWWPGSVLRGGYTYDEWAIPESTMMSDNPDADKHYFGVGTSYQYNDKMTIDVGYELRLYGNRHVTNSVYASDDPAIVGGVANGTYKEKIHAVYIGVRVTD